MIFRRSYQRELMLLTGAIFVVLLAIITTTLMVRILGEAATGHLAPEGVLITLAFSVLRYLPLLIGLALFSAILSALTRSYRDHEMEVWQSSGLSILDWVRPTMTIAVPLVLLIAALSLGLSPWAVRKSAEYRSKLASQDESLGIAPGVFREAPKSDRVFFVEDYETDGRRAMNIFVHMNTPDGGASIVVSHNGHLTTDPQGNRSLVMNDGRRYEGIPGQANFRIGDFDQYSMVIKSSAATSGDTPLNGMTTPVLLRLHDRDSAAEVAWRLALPISSALMALLAIPLSFTRPRGGRSLNLIAALLVYLLYSNCIGIAQNWISRGTVPIAVGIWPVHATVLLFAIALLAWRSGMFRRKAACR